MDHSPPEGLLHRRGVLFRPRKDVPSDGAHFYVDLDWDANTFSYYACNTGLTSFDPTRFLASPIPRRTSRRDHRFRALCPSTMKNLTDL